jgi:hypothetical protein
MFFCNFLKPDNDMDDFGHDFHQPLSSFSFFMLEKTFEQGWTISIMLRFTKSHYAL